MLTGTPEINRFDFRGYTATAPLKADQRVVKRGNRREFPWLHSHGPIEGLTTLPQIAHRFLFPWLHSHGPIEGLVSPYLSSLVLNISVATQPRPH